MQLCLNVLLPTKGLIEKVWENLDTNEKIHIINYIISMIEVHDKDITDWCSLPTLQTLNYLIDIFKVSLNVFCFLTN